MRTKIGEGNNGVLNDSALWESDLTTEAAMPAATPSTKERPVAPAASVVETTVNPATSSTSRKKQKVKTATGSSTEVTAPTTAVPAATETQSVSQSTGFPTAEAMTAVLRTAVLKVTWCIACLPEAAYAVDSKRPQCIYVLVEQLGVCFFFVTTYFIRL